MSNRSVNVIDEHIGRRITELRLTTRTSRQQLAEILSVGEAEIEQYEAGKKRLGASQLFMLAQVLDVPISTFYEGI